MGCRWDRQRPVSLSQHLKLLKGGFPDIHPHCILTFYFLNIKFSRSLITYVTQIRTLALTGLRRAYWRLDFQSPTFRVFKDPLSENSLDPIQIFRSLARALFTGKSCWRLP